MKARGVESFTLLLNDDLVDLDKEFTVVVNDKAVTEKRTRGLPMGSTPHSKGSSFCASGRLGHLARWPRKPASVFHLGAG